MKTVKRLLLLVVLLVIVGGVIFYFYMDGIVRSTVEKQANSQLNLQTNLGGASLSLLGGKVGLSDLQIANPSGFSANKMLTLGKADVQVSYSQLRGDPIRVGTITLEQPTMLLENNGGTFNFKKAFDDMPKGEPKPADDGKPPMKLIIDEFTIKDPKVVLRPGIPGLPESIDLPISTITMKNVGSGDGAQNGAAVKDIVQQVLAAMAAQASTSDKLPPQLKAILTGDLSAVTAQLKDEARKQLAKALPGPAGDLVGKVIADPSALTKDPLKAASDAGIKLPDAGKIGDDPTKALGGLLGGKKEKDKEKK